MLDRKFIYYLSEGLVTGSSTDGKGKKSESHGRRQSAVFRIQVLMFHVLITHTCITNETTEQNTCLTFPVESHEKRKAVLEAQARFVRPAPSFGAEEEETSQHSVINHQSGGKTGRESK